MGEGALILYRETGVSIKTEKRLNMYEGNMAFIDKGSN
jgi:hypothetical protein